MYCSQCGRELKDGEVCSCTQNEVKEMNSESAQARAESEAREESTGHEGAQSTASKSAPSSENGYDLEKLVLAFISVFTLILELIKRPCTTVQEFMSRDNGKMGLKLMLVKAGVASIFFMLAAFPLFAIMRSVITVLLAIVVFLLSFATDFIYSRLFCLYSAMLFKTHIDTKRAMEIVGMKNAAEIAGLILAIIGGVIPALRPLAILLGGFCGMILAYTATLQLTDINKDSRIHLFVVATATAFVIGIIAIVILFGSIILNAMGAVFNMINFKW